MKRAKIKVGFAIDGEIIIDEDGCHVRRIHTEKWKAVPIKRGRRKKISHYLHIKHDGRRQETQTKRRNLQSLQN